MRSTPVKSYWGSKVAKTHLLESNLDPLTCELLIILQLCDFLQYEILFFQVLQNSDTRMQKGCQIIGWSISYAFSFNRFAPKCSKCIRPLFHEKWYKWLCYPPWPPNNRCFYCVLPNANSREGSLWRNDPELQRKPSPQWNPDQRCGFTWIMDQWRAFVSYYSLSLNLLIMIN